MQASAQHSPKWSGQPLLPAAPEAPAECERRLRLRSWLLPRSCRCSLLRSRLLLAGRGDLRQRQARAHIRAGKTLQADAVMKGLARHALAHSAAGSLVARTGGIPLCTMRILAARQCRSGCCCWRLGALLAPAARPPGVAAAARHGCRLLHRPAFNMSRASGHVSWQEAGVQDRHLQRKCSASRRLCTQPWHACGPPMPQRATVCCCCASSPSWLPLVLEDRQRQAGHCVGRVCTIHLLAGGSRRSTHRSIASLCRLCHLCWSTALLGLRHSPRSLLCRWLRCWKHSRSWLCSRKLLYRHVWGGHCKCRRRRFFALCR